MANIKSLSNLDEKLDLIAQGVSRMDHDLSAAEMVGLKEEIRRIFLCKPGVARRYTEQIMGILRSGREVQI